MSRFVIAVFPVTRPSQNYVRKIILVVITLHTHRGCPEFCETLDKRNFLFYHYFYFMVIILKSMLYKKNDKQKKKSLKYQRITGDLKIILFFSKAYNTGTCLCLNKRIKTYLLSTFIWEYENRPGTCQFLGVGVFRFTNIFIAVRAHTSNILKVKYFIW